MAMDFSVRARLRSVRFAVAGVATMLRSQHNAWIHAAATAAVMLAGWYCGVAAAVGLTVFWPHLGFGR